MVYKSVQKKAYNFEIIISLFKAECTKYNPHCPLHIVLDVTYFRAGG